MSSLNRVQLIGNVGQQPEIRNTQKSKVASFSVATTEKYKDQENTEWHNVEAWGKLADIIEQYISKGSKVYIEGSLKTDSWEKDGVKKYKTKITAFKLIMLYSKGSQNTQKPNTQEPDNFDSDPLPF